MSIIEDYINKPKLRQSNFSKNTRNMFDAKRTDKHIKHCPTCGQCYELDFTSTKLSQRRNKTSKVYHYYNDFPTYGKKEEICPKCQ